MFPYIRNSAEVPWQPGPYEGVDLAILHKHPSSGGVTVLRRFRQGTIIPAHTHPEANESVYILSGEWIEEGVSYGPGTFLFVPRGQKHGPHFAKTEVVSVTMFDGPLTIA